MHKIKTVDFTELKKLKQPNTFTNLSIFQITAVILFVFSFFVFFIFIPKLNYLFTCMMFLSIGALFVYGLYEQTTKDRIQNNNLEVIKKFAKTNNFRFSSTDKENVIRTGTLFQHGETKLATNFIQGVYCDLPFQIFDYCFTKGSGKRIKYFPSRVFQFELPRRLPHMVIDSVIENDALEGSTLPIIFDDKQKITLEGDFSKYFNLYAPDEYGITALTLLAPDVMQTLIENASKCDIEIKGNQLFFYWPVDLSWPIVENDIRTFESMFNTTAEVLGQIKDKLTESDIYALPEQAALHSTPNGGVELKIENIPFSYAYLLYSVAAMGMVFLFLGRILVGLTLLLAVTVVGLSMIVISRRKRQFKQKAIASRYHQ